MFKQVVSSSLFLCIIGSVTARVFVLCEAFALPGARVTSEELVAAVGGAQEPDGSFRDDAWPPPVATVRGATVLARLAR